MTPAVRHGIGVLAGLAATLVIAGCLSYSVDRLRRTVADGLGASLDGTPASPDWTAFGVLLLGAAVIGLVVNARLSALASLIPGVLMTTVGLLWVLKTMWMLQHTTRGLVPDDFFGGYSNMAANGTFMIIGLALVVASLSPRRWRGTRAATPVPAASPAPAAPRKTGPGEDMVEA
ncbi:hypothetical protein ABZ806_40390 [Spirillospora sp. NPDC047418]